MAVQKTHPGHSCPRCGSPLAYVGRPCPACIAPAAFTLKAGALELSGVVRSPKCPLPRFALPAHLRDITIRAPRRQRVLKALRIAGAVTWRSVGIAAVGHLILVAGMFFFQDDLKRLVDIVHHVRIEQPLAAAPVAAPEPKPEVLPEPEPKHEDVTIAPELVPEPVLDTGDPEFEQPPEPTPYAPEPQVAPPAPGPQTPVVSKPAQAAGSLGGGQPHESKNEKTTGSGLFQNRKGEQKQAALQKHGGGEATENAVNLGLEYLAGAQGADGSWNPNRGYDAPPEWSKRNHPYRASLTALCVLPFLAAGHSTKEGKYAPNVRRAVSWLTRRQNTDGSIFDGDDNIRMYTHTVATLALCEAYGLSRDEQIGKNAERAVRFLERSQSAEGGWDYAGWVSDAGPASRRNDLSISGWAVLALKSAKAVGLRVNARTWSNLADLYHRHSLPDGHTYYADRDHGQIAATRTGIGMVGVGLTCRTVLDAIRFENRNFAAEKLLLRDLPDWEKFNEPSSGPQQPNFHTFYGWYYGTLGLFLKNNGEGPAWQTWNTALKEALLPRQVLKGERKGSWPAADSWIGPIMGDLYSTACAVLCLEVYYRYNPLHQPDPEELPAADLVRQPVQPKPGPTPDKPLKPVEIAGQTLDLAKPGDRAKYLRLLAKEKGLGAAPALLDALTDESASVRTAALYEIGKLKVKDAVEPVCAMLKRPENEDLRISIADTLGRIGDKAASGALIPLLSSTDATVSDTAHAALVKLSGGKDFGVNRVAWQDWFGRNS